MRRYHKWSKPDHETKEQTCQRCRLSRKPAPWNHQSFGYFHGKEPERPRYTTVAPNCPVER